MASATLAVDQPSAEDWQRLEQQLGLPLPQDLKQLVSGVGDGHFGEFYLLNPRSSSRRNQFSREEALLFRQNVGWVAAEAGVPLYPDPNGFIRIGFALNRMDLLLRASSNSAFYTLVWLEQDYRIAHWLEMTVSRFIHDLYFGRITEDWAREVRSLVWGPDEPLFLPPDQFDVSGYS